MFLFKTRNLIFKWINILKNFIFFVSILIINKQQKLLKCFEALDAILAVNKYQVRIE